MLCYTSPSASLFLDTHLSVSPVHPISGSSCDLSFQTPFIRFLFISLIIPLFQPIYIPVSLTSSLSLCLTEEFNLLTPQLSDE